MHTFGYSINNIIRIIHLLIICYNLTAMIILGSINMYSKTKYITIMLYQMILKTNQ